MTEASPPRSLIMAARLDERLSRVSSQVKEALEEAALISNRCWDQADVKASRLQDDCSESGFEGLVCVPAGVVALGKSPLQTRTAASLSQQSPLAQLSSSSPLRAGLMSPSDSKIKRMLDFSPTLTSRPNPDAVDLSGRQNSFPPQKSSAGALREVTIPQGQRDEVMLHVMERKLEELQGELRLRDLTIADQNQEIVELRRLLALATQQGQEIARR